MARTLGVGAGDTLDLRFVDQYFQEVTGADQTSTVESERTRPETFEVVGTYRVEDPEAPAWFDLSRFTGLENLVPPPAKGEAAPPASPALLVDPGSMDSQTFRGGVDRPVDPGAVDLDRLDGSRRLALRLPGPAARAEHRRRGRAARPVHPLRRGPRRAHAAAAGDGRRAGAPGRAVAAAAVRAGVRRGGAAPAVRRARQAARALAPARCSASRWGSPSWWSRSRRRSRSARRCCSPTSSPGCGSTPGIPVAVDGVAWLALAAVVVSALVASAMAALDVIREPLSRALASALTRRETSRGRLVLRSAVVAVAVAAVAQLLTSGDQSSQLLALLAPLLIALAVAVGGAWLLRAASTRWLGRTTYRARHPGVPRLPAAGPSLGPRQPDGPAAARGLGDHLRRLGVGGLGRLAGEPGEGRRRRRADLPDRRCRSGGCST